MPKSVVGYLYGPVVPASLREAEPFIGHLDQTVAITDESGIQSVVIKEAEKAFLKGKVTVYPVARDGEISESFRTIPLERIGILYNFLGRKVVREMICTDEGFLPPIVNENAAHNLGRDKFSLYRHILRPLGSIPTALVRSERDAAKFMGRHPEAPGYILKPNNGHAGIGVYHFAAHEVRPYLNRRPDCLSWDNLHILQPAYNFTRPFLKSIRPYDKAAVPSFTYWNKTVAAPKELRVYTFTSPVKTTVFPVGRVLQNGNHWFFVDPESVPQKVLQTAHTAAMGIAEVTRSKALYTAIDIGYGSLPGKRPGWHIIEANPVYPYIVDRDELHDGVVQQLRKLIAHQIIETVASADSLV